MAAPQDSLDAGDHEPATRSRRSEGSKRASIGWLKTLARIRRRDRKRRPVAHAAFLVLGLISAWASYIAYECRHEDLAVAFGFGVFTLFLLPITVAFVLGPLRSLTDWSDRRLLISNALTLVVLSARAVVPDEFYWMPLTFFAAACMILNLDWFIRGPR